jgi:DNA modification methylase
MGSDRKVLEDKEHGNLVGAEQDARIQFKKFDIAPLAGSGVINEIDEEEFENYINDKGQKFLDSYEVSLYGGKGKAHYDQGKKHSKYWKVTDHVTWASGSGDKQNLVFGTKPIQILVPYIKILSPRDGIVLEPYAGSGSTIIASEIMKRKCRAIEISPTYGEVIIARFERFTGKTALKLN